MALTKVSTHVIADDLALPGNPTTTTQSAGNNTTRLATTAFVTGAVSDLVDGAPSTLNTLNEIAAALNDDAALNTTLTNSIATKLPLAGGTMTGDLVLDDSDGDRFLTLDKSATGTSGILLKNSGNSKVKLLMNSSEEFELHTNNALAMKVKESGFVGIGPTQPLAALHISGNSDDSDEACQLIIDDEDTTAGSQIPSIQFRANGSNLGRIRGSDAGIVMSGSSANNDDLVVKNDAVGINESTPLRQLHVNSGSTNVVARFESTDSIAAAEFKDNGGSAEVGAIGNHLAFYPAGSERARVNDDGCLIVGGGSTHLNVLSGSPQIQVGNGSGHSSMQFYSGTGSVGALYFGDATSGTGRYSGYIEYRHNDDTMGIKVNEHDALHLRYSDAHLCGEESDARLYIGSQGGKFGANSSNWVRASGGTMMYNAAGGSHIWEIGGTQRLSVSSTGVITQQTAGTSDSYDMILRSTDSGDPGLSITRDNVVGFGIAVRGATTDYADFQVSASGATGYTDAGRMRLYANGDICMPGDHTYNQDSGIQFYADSGRYFQTFSYDSVGAEVCIQNNKTSGGTVAALQYRINNSAQSGGSIYASTSGYTGGNFSDYRLKNNVQNLTGSLEKISQLRAVSYKHVDTPDKTELGFIAHEINEVFPEFVHGEKDAVWTQGDIDNYPGALPDVKVGDIKAQEVDYFSKEWTTHILHAIKELKEENDALKARVATLEG